MRNVDPVKYNNDHADCSELKRNSTFVGNG